MKTSFLCGSLLFATLLISGEPAWADSESVDAPESPEFQALYGKAREESNKGKLKEAVRLYKAAYELRPNPVLLYNIARLLHKLTRFQEASIYYQLFLDSPVEDSEQKRKAREYIEALREKPSPEKVVPSTPVDVTPTVPDAAASPSPTTSASTPAGWGLDCPKQSRAPKCQRTHFSMHRPFSSWSGVPRKRFRAR